MKSDIFSLFLVFLLLQVCFHLFCGACTVFEKVVVGVGWKMDAIQQFSRNLNNSLANLLSTSSSVAGMSLSGALPVETLHLTYECPVECLTFLTAYRDEQRNIVVMLRPGDVDVFLNYTAMDVNKLVCAVSYGYCGASVPLYLLYSEKNQDYYIAFHPENQTTYSVQYSGNPLCYLWTNSFYSTSTTTTISSRTTSRSTSAYNTTATTAFPILGNGTTTRNLTIFNSTLSQPVVTNFTTSLVNGSTTTIGHNLNKTIATTSTESISGLFNNTTTATPNITKANHEKKFSNFWPLILAGIVGIGVLVITVLALSTLSIIRSGKRAIRPQNTSCSPPPPYNYTQDLSSDLPPAPVSASSAPQPLTVNSY